MARACPRTGTTTCTAPLVRATAALAGYLDRLVRRAHGEPRLRAAADHVHPSGERRDTDAVPRRREIREPDPPFLGDAVGKHLADRAIGLLATRGDDLAAERCGARA